MCSLDRFKPEKYVYIYTERTGTNSFFVRKDKYNLVKHLLGEPINRFSSSQRFHLGNYEPKSGHKFTPPTKKQL